MYTVLSRDGRVAARNVSLAEAARLILKSASREFEIRPAEGGGYRLWSASDILSREQDPAAAERDILDQVVRRAAQWGDMVAVPDEEYQKVMDNIE